MRVLGTVETELMLNHGSMVTFNVVSNVEASEVEIGREMEQVCENKFWGVVKDHKLF